VIFPALDGSGNVNVCGDTSEVCHPVEKICIQGCTGNVSCTGTGVGTRCNTTTRLCECTGDGECTAQGVSRCNLTTGRCECASDNDCRRADGGAIRPERDVCVAGVCSCSSASACVRSFVGTTESCQ
jgi:hypothetical protein